MSKQFKPVMGMPVDDFLVRMVADVKENHQNNPSTGPRMGRSVREVENIAESVRRSLNTGTCMNESQAAEVKNSILFDRRGDAKVVKELIDRVNGFRLDCGNCLREKCEMRDPQAALGAVTQELKPMWPDFAAAPSIYALELSNRVRGLLWSNGFRTIPQLEKLDWDDVNIIEGFGKKSYLAVKTALSNYSQGKKGV